MKRLTEEELKKAQDYEELKWDNGLPVIVGAFGETWKRVAAADAYSQYFIVSDENDTEDFYGTYSDDEPTEKSD